MRFGVEDASVLFVAAATYVALTALIRWRAYARHEASSVLVRTQLGADAVVVHVCALMLTPPSPYDRTLVISMFLVPLSQLDFG